MVESGSGFRIVAWIVVPTGTRISGPGTLGALPSSPNAGTGDMRPVVRLGEPVGPLDHELDGEGAVLQATGRGAVVVGHGPERRTGRVGE